MFEAGWASALSCRALRHWSMDTSVEGGGILEVDKWIRIDSSAEYPGSPHAHNKKDSASKVLSYGNGDV